MSTVHIEAVIISVGLAEKVKMENSNIGNAPLATGAGNDQKAKPRESGVLLPCLEKLLKFFFRHSDLLQDCSVQGFF